MHADNQKQQNIFSLLVHFIKMPDTMQRSFIDIQVDLNLQTILQGHPTENENIVQIVKTFLTRSKRFSIIKK